MATAIVKVELPNVVNAVGLTWKLFSHPGAANGAPIAVTSAGLPLTVDTVQADVYWGSVDATTLLGLYAFVIFEGANIVGRGYINMTNAAVVHVVMQDPWIGSVDGSKVASLGAFTDVLTESYRATGAEGTAAQLLYEILGNLAEATYVGTTKTIKKINGTPAKTYTMDDAVDPTTITELT